MGSNPPFRTAEIGGLVPCRHICRVTPLRREFQHALRTGGRPAVKFEDDIAGKIISDTARANPDPFATQVLSLIMAILFRPPISLSAISSTASVSRVSRSMTEAFEAKLKREATDKQDIETSGYFCSNANRKCDYEHSRNRRTGTQ